MSKHVWDPKSWKCVQCNKYIENTHNQNCHGRVDAIEWLRKKDAKTVR